jgi:mono/diheme cytochrome c family protein
MRRRVSRPAGARAAFTPARAFALAWTATLAACTPPLALADESALRLVAAPGSELVAARCVACHSVDYIVMNAPIQGRSGWEATVTKMIKVMQAPITPEDAATIVAYLDAHYGAPLPARRP